MTIAVYNTTESKSVSPAEISCNAIHSFPTHAFLVAFLIIGMVSFLSKWYYYPFCFLTLNGETIFYLLPNIAWKWSTTQILSNKSPYILSSFSLTLITSLLRFLQFYVQWSFSNFKKKNQAYKGGQNRLKLEVRGPCGQDSIWTILFYPYPTIFWAFWIRSYEIILQLAL